MALVTQMLQFNNSLYHHCGRPPVLPILYMVCILPLLFPACNSSPPVLVCELLQDRNHTSHFPSVLSSIEPKFKDAQDQVTHVN